MLLENRKDRALDTLGQSKETIVWYDKVLALDPNNVSALNKKAFALANLHKNEETLSLIVKVLDQILMMNIIFLRLSL